MLILKSFSSVLSGNSCTCKMNISGENLILLLYEIKGNCSIVRETNGEMQDTTFDPSTKISVSWQGDIIKHLVNFPTNYIKQYCVLRKCLQVPIGSEKKEESLHWIIEMLKYYKTINFCILWWSLEKWKTVSNQLSDS